METDLSAYTEVEHQVWVETHGGGRYAYRVDLPRVVAENWAEQWNKAHPSDVPDAKRFFAVAATTTFQEV